MANNTLENNISSLVKEVRRVTLAFTICSMLETTSSSSSLSSLFSFSSFCLTLCRLSICSPRSATLSACFFLSVAAVDSCCRVASSRSLRSFWNSASLFLFISIWADVAPPASSSLSLISSSSLAKSALCFSTLARAARSASSSSSSSSMRAYINTKVKYIVAIPPCWMHMLFLNALTCNSFNFFWSWALMACSSSIFPLSTLISKSFLCTTKYYFSLLKYIMSKDTPMGIS